jgi:LysR family transcriptional regulator of abg operon
MSFQIKFHQIRAFVEVARHGSIRGASRTLAVSQPALTKSIRELETGMGAQLFVRRSQGVALTVCGDSFFQHACLILEELRAARESIAQTLGEFRGQVNIGLGASISRSLMPTAIANFQRQHPEVKVRIVEGQLVSMIDELRQGKLDFTINTWYRSPWEREFSFEKLLEKRFAIFARPDHPAIDARHLSQLSACRWAMPSPQGSYFRQMEEFFQRHDIQPDIGVVCETFTSSINLAARSDYLTVLPEDMGQDIQHRDLLKRLNIQELLPMAGYYLIQRRDTPPTPLTALLISHFRRLCASRDSAFPLQEPCDILVRS